METHGNDSPLERIVRLEAEISSALADRDLAADADERSDGHHHPAEAATDAELRERQLQDTLRMRQQLERLTRARAAIAAGTYGICVDCGTPIPDGRLIAIPDADRCVSCKSIAARRR
jgi:DnaK suppressor protein